MLMEKNGIFFFASKNMNREKKMVDSRTANKARNVMVSCFVHTKHKPSNLMSELQRTSNRSPGTEVDDF